MTTATQLAIKDAQETLRGAHPNQVYEYQKVFDETSAQRLPECRSWTMH